MGLRAGTIEGGGGEGGGGEEGDDDDDDASSAALKKRTPKKAATNKGSSSLSSSRKKNDQKTKKGASSPSKSKGGGEATSARMTEGPQKKSRTRGKQSSKRKPLEISAESLSPSQTEANDPPTRPTVIDDDIDDGGGGYESQNQSYNIPRTGYSLADRLEKTGPGGLERFETTLTPIITGVEREEEKEVEFQYDEDGFPIGFTEVETKPDGDDEEEEEERGGRHQGVARIDTVSTLGDVGEEPVRWVVSLGEDGDGSGRRGSYAMIDLPPYSDGLADEIRSFMDPSYDATSAASVVDDGSDGSTGSNGGDREPKSALDVILLTNQQCIHYDASPAVYVTRESDLKQWKAAFPGAEVVMYRLDIPRECRDGVTQVLDGYGPWGWEEEDVVVEEEDGAGGAAGQRGRFVETGRPLTIDEWDDDTKSGVLSRGELPPDDLLDDANEDDDDDDEEYSPQAIRQREGKYRLLAVYTPGHTFGSVTYVFPGRGICCSGHALPLESSMAGAGAAYDDDDEEDEDPVTATNGPAVSPPPPPPGGPRIDYRGYLATSASRSRQMSSASALINGYADRFRVVLPARGDVVFLDSDEGVRMRELAEGVGLYRRIGDIYGRLGIVE